MQSLVQFLHRFVQPIILIPSSLEWDILFVEFIYWILNLFKVFIQDLLIMHLDTPKFFAGVMSAMSAMLQLGIPHINVLTKMDLLGKKAGYDIER